MLDEASAKWPASHRRTPFVPMSTLSAKSCWLWIYSKNQSPIVNNPARVEQQYSACRSLSQPPVFPVHFLGSHAGRVYRDCVFTPQMNLCVTRRWIFSTSYKVPTSASKLMLLLLLPLLPLLLLVLFQLASDCSKYKLHCHHDARRRGWAVHC